MLWGSKSHGASCFCRIEEAAGRWGLGLGRGSQHSGGGPWYLQVQMDSEAPGPRKGRAPAALGWMLLLHSPRSRTATGEDRMVFSELKPSDQSLGTCQKAGGPAASRWHRGGSLCTGGLGLLERPLWCSSPQRCLRPQWRLQGPPTAHVTTAATPGKLGDPLLVL